MPLAAVLTLAVLLGSSSTALAQERGDAPRFQGELKRLPSGEEIVTTPGMLHRQPRPDEVPPEPRHKPANPNALDLYGGQDPGSPVTGGPQPGPLDLPSTQQR